MSQKNKFFGLVDFKVYLKEFRLTLIYSFIIGLIIGFLPLIYKSKENFKLKKLIEEQKKIQIQNKEKICKDDNSDYKKFINLGFPKTAIEKFNLCMREQ